MGFKWFKARIRMNRMPSHSSAVAGSYKTMSFDTTNIEFKSNNNEGDYVRTKSEPKLSIRPISMPILDNPMTEIAGEDNALEFVPSSNNETARSLSTINLMDLEYSGENMYRGLGAGEPIPLINQKLNLDSSEHVETLTPKPAQKIKNGDYKRKKVKAPAPKINLSRNSATTSENGTNDFMELGTKRKTSQDSDIDV